MFEEEKKQGEELKDEGEEQENGEGDETEDEERNIVTATEIFKQQLGEKLVKNPKGETVNVFPPIPKFTKSIRIDVVLNGVLDLSILKEEGYNRVTELIFKSANIDPKIQSTQGLTQILNIPPTIEKIVCKGHQLNLIDPLGENIKELDLEDNQLDELEFTKFPNLVKLNISHNNFQELSELPSKLKYLNCSFNEIRFLDLEGLYDLTHLYINDNKLVSLLNIPDKSLKQVAYYNNPLKEIHLLENIPNLAIVEQNGLIKPKKAQAETDAIEPPPGTSYVEPIRREDIPEGEGAGAEEEDMELTYKEAIYKYFKLKKNYETGLKEKIAAIKQQTKDNQRKRRILLASLKGNCIICKRNVGSIFTKEDNYYRALCGDVGKNPCRLNIKIFNGVYYNFFDDMHYFKEYTEKSVQEIIKQKMDVLFNYENEVGISKRFEETLKKYTDYNDGFMVLYNTYKEIYENPAKKELIRLKNERINELMSEINETMEEYRKTPTNNQLLREAVERQQTDLVNEVVGLRRLKYEEMYVMCDLVEKEGKTGGTLPPICTLVQNEHRVDKFVNMLEEPKVIRFQT
jgi:hypothetical protein